MKAAKRRTAMTSVVLCLLAMALGCTVYGGKAHKGWSGASGGEDLERQFWADIKARNFSELEKHMAVSWVFLSATGPLDRVSSLERFQNSGIKDYRLSDFKVTPNGHDMVVTYTANVRNGSGTATSMRMMTVWQRTERSWIAIAHAEVP
jgi:hypothetical protein